MSTDPDAMACQAIMDILAVLSPAGVSRSLLYDAAQSGALPGCGEPAGTRLVDEAVGLLAGGSLLSFSGDGGSVAAHRLVMRVVRERSAREGTLGFLGMRACGLLVSAIASLGEPWENRVAARDVIQQVIALHQHTLPCLEDNPALEAGLLSLRGIAHYWLTELGDAVGLAVDVGRSVLADCERVLGSTHPDTLQTRGNLATAYQAAGRIGEAIPVYEATFADCERVLGTTHPDTLRSRNNLATAYQAAGRIDEAIPVYEATLADCERVLSTTHPDTLTSRSNLAAAYRAVGRLNWVSPASVERSS